MGIDPRKLADDLIKSGILLNKSNYDRYASQQEWSHNTKILVALRLRLVYKIKL